MELKMEEEEEVEEAMQVLLQVLFVHKEVSSILLPPMGALSPLTPAGMGFIPSGNASGSRWSRGCAHRCKAGTDPAGPWSEIGRAHV